MGTNAHAGCALVGGCVPQASAGQPYSLSGALPQRHVDEDLIAHQPQRSDPVLDAI